MNIIQRRVQAGVTAWKRVDGITWGRKMILKLRVFECWAVSANIDGMGTLV